MTKLITGLFPSAEEAQRAERELIEAGLPRDSIIMEQAALGAAHYAGPRLQIHTDDYTADVVYKVFRNYDVAMSVDVSGNVYEHEVGANERLPSSEQWHESAEPPGLSGLSLAGGPELMTPEGTHTGLDSPADPGIARPKATRTGEDAEQNERRIEPADRS